MPLDIAILLPPDDAAPSPEDFLANPAKYQHNRRLLYCNTFVNLSRPSNVKTHAIQFLIWNGDRFAARPVCITDKDGGIFFSLEMKG